VVTASRAELREARKDILSVQELPEVLATPRSGSHQVIPSPSATDPTPFHIDDCVTENPEQGAHGLGEAAADQPLDCVELCWAQFLSCDECSRQVRIVDDNQFPASEKARVEELLAGGDPWSFTSELGEVGAIFVKRTPRGIGTSARQALHWEPFRRELRYDIDAKTVLFVPRMRKRIPVVDSKFTCQPRSPHENPGVHFVTTDSVSRGERLSRPRWRGDHQCPTRRPLRIPNESVDRRLD
jgi:hypothetical protein